MSCNVGYRFLISSPNILVVTWSNGIFASVGVGSEARLKSSSAAFGTGGVSEYSATVVYLQPTLVRK